MIRTYILLISAILLFSGCAGDVVTRTVPGPVRVVYIPQPIPELPSKPKEPKLVNFHKIEFDNNIYYGLTKNEAVDLTVNILNKQEYCKRLEAIINNLKKDRNRNKKESGLPE
jgi:hypothetical protein